jgi:hypothetical protein
MNLPKLLSADEVASYLDVSVATLDRWRSEGTGPNYIKAGSGIRYPENCVAEYVQAQLQLPDPSGAATPAAMRQAVLNGGFKEVGEAHRARVKEMQDLDREDTTEANPYAVTVSRVGETPGSQIQHINLVPPTDVIAPASPHILTSR